MRENVPLTLLPLSRTILHMDMDAFFAAIEQADNPALKGKPVIVGGAKRGVVSTASYEARKYGVRSAMPIFEARRRCPQGIFLPVRMERYQEVSQKVMAILEAVSPLVEQGIHRRGLYRSCGHGKAAWGHYAGRS